MKTISYNKELLTATGEMIRLFSNISIFQLHDENGNKTKTKKSKKILVPCKYAQTSRILKSLMNPKGSQVEFPLITLEKRDIQCDLSRNTEIHHDIATQYGEYDPNTHPPIPITINFNLNIFGKYPEDVDMIVSNFAPWFNSDVYVTSPHPKLENRYLNHQVLWNGSVSYDWKSSLQNTEQDIIRASTSFEFKTELYAGYERLKDDDGGIIKNVVFDYAVTESGNNYPEYDEDAIAEKGNLAGGFFCVPYEMDFDTYANNIIDNTVKLSEIEHDGFSVHAMNEKFNRAVFSNDYDAMIESVEGGADIYKHSYYPYAYASAMEYGTIVDWLEQNNALKPTFEESGKEIPHYPVDDSVKIASMI